MTATLGILGRKLGMTRIFGDDGSVIPVTVIEAGPCPVTQVKTEDKDGYHAMQLGFAQIPERKVNKPDKGHLDKAARGYSGSCGKSGSTGLRPSNRART